MQVASRLFVVWGVLYPFAGDLIGQYKGFGGDGDRVGSLAYLGCLLAWGVTEVIRYGFFVMQVNGGVECVPWWWQWLRYNTFYVLYPVGISSECTLAYKALGPARGLHWLYWCFVVAVLVVYVPGMSHSDFFLMVTANAFRLVCDVFAYDSAATQDCRCEGE